MPVQGGRWRRVWELRALQLQRQLQAREERIVQLETENAALHLRLAQHWGQPSESTATHATGCRQRGAGWTLAQLRQQTQELRAVCCSARALLSHCEDEHQRCVAEIVDTVQQVQSHPDAAAAWRLRVVALEQRLLALTRMCDLERRERKALHNRLVELRGNVRVHCRIRPPLCGDAASPGRSVPAAVVHALDDETVVVQCAQPGHPPVSRTYTFERVLAPTESQSAVFKDVRPLLRSLLDGYDVCVMAYGQSGSGKSYTMLGPDTGEQPLSPGDAPAEEGLVPRAARELFRLISEDPWSQPQVDVSILQIYNNDIFDLLNKDGHPASPGVKREVTTTKQGRKEVSPLTRVCVRSAAEFMTLVAGGLQLRARHPTLVHAASSRSHLIITATLTAASRSSSGDPQADPSRSREPSSPLTPPATHTAASVCPGSLGQYSRPVLATLQLVDLAGSECAGVSGVSGPALRETSFINRSLAALGDVLAALEQRRGHVPYRNSKLTHALQDALGGDAKLLVLVCLSPCARHVAETLQSLGFGARARQVQRGPPKCRLKSR